MCVPQHIYTEKMGFIYWCSFHHPTYSTFIQCAVGRMKDEVFVFLHHDSVYYIVFPQSYWNVKSANAKLFDEMFFFLPHLWYFLQRIQANRDIFNTHTHSPSGAFHIKGFSCYCANKCLEGWLCYVKGQCQPEGYNIAKSFFYHWDSRRRRRVFFQ